MDDFRELDRAELEEFCAQQARDLEHARQEAERWRHEHTALEKALQRRILNLQEQINEIYFGGGRAVTLEDVKKLQEHHDNRSKDNR